MAGPFLCLLTPICIHSRGGGQDSWQMPISDVPACISQDVTVHRVHQMSCQVGYLSESCGGETHLPQCLGWKCSAFPLSLKTEMSNCLVPVSSCW